MKEPRRLRELRPELGESLARALEPAAVEPSALELQELTSKLGVTLGVPLTPPAAAAVIGKAAALTGASKVLPAWKLAAWVLGGVALGVGLSGVVTSALSTSDNPAPLASRTPPAPVSAAVIVAQPAPSPRLLAPSASRPRSERADSAPSVARPVPNHGATAASDGPAPPRPDELSILHQAQVSLRSNPAQALALSARHELEFPHGGLAQEREVIAIEALIELGRAREARARAARFEAQYPGSAHTPRVEQLLNDGPSP